MKQLTVFDGMSSAADDDHCDLADSGDEEPCLGRPETFHNGQGTSMGAIMDGEFQPKRLVWENCGQGKRLCRKEQ